MTLGVFASSVAGALLKPKFKNFSLQLGTGATAATFLHYKDREMEISAAIQFLRNNPDLIKVSKRISRSHSRSHSKTKRRRSS